MPEAETAAWLCTAAAVRERCGTLLALAEADELPHFQVDDSRLAPVAEYTAQVIRGAYPTLDIPHHARWRHFTVGGVDRWALLRQALGPLDAAELARTRIDLCVVSVLLDAGAGPDWRYREPATGLVLGRSEGLAIASLDAFRAGLFSADGRPRADAAGLARVDSARLGDAFQAGAGNPLFGLEGRAALMRNLGAALASRPDLFGPGRIGYLYDVIAEDGPVQATTLLTAVLDGLAGVWPSRLTLAGRRLGDVWRHPAISGDGLVPFHKLSQWLSYSLIEVFEDAGIPVAGVGELTGLAEYRNGGLFLDGGVLRLRDAGLAQQKLPVEHLAVVEWRALTVALLDRLAPLIRARLGRDEHALPLSRILEGGTWAAGRKLAAEHRPGGPPPLQIVSDGTVF